MVWVQESLGKREALEFMDLQKDDVVIITAGFNSDVNSKEFVKTNLMKIEII